MSSEAKRVTVKKFINLTSNFSELRERAEAEENNMRFVLILVSLFLFNMSGYAHSGGVGNGGDTDEILFHAIAEQISLFLNTSAGKSQFPEIDPTKFKELLETTKVRVVETDLMDVSGTRRTAINQPSKQLILVDRRLWGPERDN